MGQQNINHEAASNEFLLDSPRSTVVIPSAATNPALDLPLLMPDAP
jgi:hypothetical protein